MRPFPAAARALPNHPAAQCRPPPRGLLRPTRQHPRTRGRAGSRHVALGSPRGVSGRDASRAAAAGRGPGPRAVVSSDPEEPWCALQDDPHPIGDGDRAAGEAAGCETEQFRFEGTRRLYGDARFDALANAHVVVFGMGGVGSWAVEALARSGVGALTLVDLDFVCVTNVNRQVLASDATVGQPKADVMAARVRDINPACDVVAINDFVTGDNVVDLLGLGLDGTGEDKGHDAVDDADGINAPGGGLQFRRRRVDYVLDAIDSERDKAAVVACCVHHRVPVMVTGGAGGIDAMGDCIVEDLAEAKFNRLAQRVRRILRRDYAFPKGESRYPDGHGNGNAGGKGKAKKKSRGGKFGVKCVYAPENTNFFKAKPGIKGRGGIGCDGVGGSAVFVTGALGFKAASHIVLQIMKAAEQADAAAAIDIGTPASSGWRSRVWPANKQSDNEDKKEVVSRGSGGSGSGGEGGGGGGRGGGRGGRGGGGDEREEGDGLEGGGSGDGGVAHRGAEGASVAAGLAVAAGGEESQLSGDEEHGQTITQRRVGDPDNSITEASPSTSEPNGVTRSRSEVNSPSSASADALTLPLGELFDAHCHWHLDGNTSGTVALARSLSGAAFTSTQPEDWDAAAASAAAAVLATDDAATAIRAPGFGLALGLHPWWAHHHPINANPTWVDTLRSYLNDLPAAIVGEIGLDRVAVPMDEHGNKTGEPDYQNQLDCFNAQLALAAEMERPIAMHCVKAYGDVGNIFRARETMPPRVLMHSYGGTVGFLEGLIKMKRWGSRFYFGFSAVVNLRSPKTGAVIRAVPADRLVLESDLVSPENAEGDLRTVLAFVAEARGWTVAETARITRENAERFYSTEQV